MRQVIWLLLVRAHHIVADHHTVVDAVAVHIVEGAAHTGLVVVGHQDMLDNLAEVALQAT